MKLLAALFILICMTTVSGCSESAGNVVSEQVPTARIELVSTESGEQVRRLTGVVQAGSVVNLAFKVAGHIDEIHVIEGSQVAKGTLIARLEQADFVRAVNEAKLRFDQAELDLQRQRNLRQKNLIAESALDEGQTQRALRQFELEGAAQALRESSLHAPFDGQLTRRLLDNHNYVAAGDPIARLQDMGRLRVVAAVPETMVSMVVSGEAIVRATFPVAPNESSTLQFREIIAESTISALTYPVLMSIEGPVPAGILPDMSVVLSVYQPASPNPLPVVPIGAIDFTPARETAVWVWDPVTEKVTRRTVIARHPVGDHVLVESGLAAGEQIVTAGIGALAEGTRIRPLVTATR